LQTQKKQRNQTLFYNHPRHRHRPPHHRHQRLQDIQQQKEQQERLELLNLMPHFLGQCQMHWLQQL
jgi:hypothetical protein